MEFDDRPWDFAAGACLISEAGGVVTTPDGGPLGLVHSGYVAANPGIHDELVKLVRPLLQEDAR